MRYPPNPCEVRGALSPCLDSGAGIPASNVHSLQHCQIGCCGWAEYAGQILLQVTFVLSLASNGGNSAWSY